MPGDSPEPREASGARVAAPLAVRRAELGDARAVAQVHRESWRTTYGGILPAEVIATEAGRRSEEAWRQRLATPVAEEATWLAEREGAVVGFASCGPARHRLRGLEAEIYALYVLQEQQRRGVGRALVRACAAHFVRQGRFGFYLWVLKANRARLFYESMGGEEVAQKHERLGQHAFAEIAYAWDDLTALVRG